MSAIFEKFFDVIALDDMIAVHAVNNMMGWSW